MSWALFSRRFLAENQKQITFAQMIDVRGSSEYNVRTSQRLELSLACPFFMPTHRSDEGAWLHPSRLPLGCGWEGHCTAPGYEGVVPNAERLHQDCSLGYATNCPHLPASRQWDAIRFSVARENESEILLAYSCERNHLPAGHGNLEYRLQNSEFTAIHPDGRIQKMAECFLESWLRRTRSRFASENNAEKSS